MHFQVFLKVTDISGQDETDSLADSRHDENDQGAIDELPSSHMTDGVVGDSSEPDVEMMDVTGFSESDSWNKPLLELNRCARNQTDAGKLWSY